MIANINSGTGAPKLALSREEAAECLGVSTATIDRWTKRGLLRACRVGRRVIYSVREIERFLREHTKTWERVCR